MKNKQTKTGFKKYFPFSNLKWNFCRDDVIKNDLSLLPLRCTNLVQRRPLHQLERGRVYPDLIDFHRLVHLRLFPRFDLRAANGEQGDGGVQRGLGGRRGECGRRFRRR